MDMVIDLLDIQRNIFNLQFAKPFHLHCLTGFQGVREPGQVKKLGLRKGKRLAKDHTACTWGSGSRRLAVCKSQTRTLSTTLCFCLCSKSYGKNLPWAQFLGVRV